jgi:hypothetical protein
MADVVSEAMEKVGSSEIRDTRDVLEADRAARQAAGEAAERLGGATTGAKS